MSNISRISFLLRLLIGAAALTLVACGGGDSGVDGGGGGKITLKGNFTSGVNASPFNKVIMFNSKGEHEIAQVTNGAFTIGVSRGTPWGMVFAGSADDYRGYLTLLAGIDTLPLSNVENSVTTIDLQTLSSLGTIVEPSHDPIGTEIALSADEKLALAQADDFLASVAKNADTDNNGKLDILEGKFFSPFIMFFIDGGSFGGALTPTIPSGLSAFNSWRFCMSAGLQSSYPSFVTMTGPAGSGISGTSEFAQIFESNRLYSSHLSYAAYPVEGTYNVDYNSDTLSFYIPDQLQALNRVIMAVPTVSLNANNTISKISWIYKMPGGGSTLTPESVITDLIVQIDGNGTPCGNYTGQDSRIYNSANLPASTTEVTLSCSINWADVTTMHMAYNDAYGNHNVVTYQK